MQRICSIGLADLGAACGRLGFDGLPSPFFINDRFLDLDDTAPPDDTDAARAGMRQVSEFLEGYRTAHIWVEARVFRSISGRPDIRILGYRSDAADCVAAQQPDDDVVDIWSIPDDGLGQTIADLLPISRPGAHPRVCVPSYTRYLRPAADPVPIDDDDFVVTIRDNYTPTTSASAPTELDEDVAELGVIQIHHRPPTGWGIDWSKDLTAWLHVADDGDYVYRPELDYASPVTRSDLARRFEVAGGTGPAVPRR